MCLSFWSVHLSLFLECLVISLLNCIWICSVLVLMRIILLISFGIWKVYIETKAMVIVARAHLSQLKIVHPYGVFTFGMSIAVIRQVDSWGIVAPTSVYVTEVSEHRATNSIYVIRSIVMLLLSRMLVLFGLLKMSLISSSISRIFKFYVLHDQEINQLIVFSMLFVFQPDRICSWEFVLVVLCSS